MRRCWIIRLKSCVRRIGREAKWGVPQWDVPQAGYSYLKASMGLSWDAWCAGQLPNTIPTSSEKPVAKIIENAESFTAHPAKFPIMPEMPAPSKAANFPADKRYQCGLDEELDHDIDISRPYRLAQAYLARAFRHGNEHYIHDTYTADEERYRRDGAQEQGHRLGRRLERLF